MHATSLCLASLDGERRTNDLCMLHSMVVWARPCVYALVCISDAFQVGCHHLLA